MGDALLNINAVFCHRRAELLISDGLKAASQGLSDRATLRFKAALRLERSAEAYTYWAWMESMKGNFHAAIHLCREAIRVDPTFGNPYNDIGSYLVALAQKDEALLWFLKAKESKRYSLRHYPFMNAGRIYMERGEHWRALKEYKQAEKFAPQGPDTEGIKATIRELEQKIM